MRSYTTIVCVLSAVVGISQLASAAPQDEIHARFEQWISAYNAGDLDHLLQLYDQQARLFSTGGSEKPIDGREAIRAYFTPIFTRGAGSVVFDHDDMIKAFSDVGVETGYYHFDTTDPNGKPILLMSRYTFVFVKTGGDWMIIHHHSSRIPRPTVVPPK
jgi:uncharacterized protein (TIGR02246 family)